MAEQLSLRMTIPPPVAMIDEVSSAINLFNMDVSRARKPSSPSTSKIHCMSAPQASTISSSMSKNGRFRALANCLPTVLLPAPMGPMRKRWSVAMGYTCSSIIFGVMKMSISRFSKVRICFLNKFPKRGKSPIIGT